MVKEGELQLLEESAYVADVGGPDKDGYHTIFPTEDMSFDEFNNKLQQIETTHVGKVDKKKGFVPKSC